MNGLTGPIANSILVGQQGAVQPRANPSNVGQLRMLQMNHRQQHAKKDNINQVIKDCFITKRVGPKHGSQAAAPRQLKIPAKTAPEFNSQTGKAHPSASNKVTVGNASKQQPAFRLEYPHFASQGQHSTKKPKKQLKKPKSPTGMASTKVLAGMDPVPLSQNKALQQHHQQVFLQLKQQHEQMYKPVHFEPNASSKRAGREVRTAVGPRGVAGRVLSVNQSKPAVLLQDNFMDML